MSFAAQKPALTGDALAWVDVHDAGTFTNDVAVRQYRQLIVSYPYFASAMDFSSQHADVQNAIWSAIDAAETLGYVAAVPAPVDLAVTTSSQAKYTRDEAIDSYSAKVAHALFVEVHKLVGWSLAEYSEDELRFILDPTELYRDNVGAAWDTEGTFPQAVQHYVCDHSPKTCYDIAQPYVANAANIKNGIINLIIDWAGRYVHGAGGQDCTTVDVFEAGLNARGGCWPMSALFATVARSVNLSVKNYTGYWGNQQSTGHANWVAFEGNGNGRVLLHGDDTYGGLSTGGGGLHRTVPYVDWKPLVFDEVDTYERGTQGLRFSALIRTSYPYQTLLNLFPFSTPLAFAGWRYLSWRYLGTFHPPVLTIAEYAQGYDNYYKVLGTRETGLPPKPTTSTTGTSGTLTPDTGPTTISVNSTVYENMDHTGTITVTANFVVIRNCRIDGNGGVGIVVDPAASNLIIESCELTNCATAAITGLPGYVQLCHIHGNTNDCLHIGGSGQSGNGYLMSILYHNYIDAGANGYALRCTDPAERIHAEYNVMVSSAAVPLILIDGTPLDHNRICHNWLDGGSYAIDRNHFTVKDLYVYKNLFGRSSTVGLFADTNGPAVKWGSNVYENDNSTANETDTAPL